MSKFLSIGLPVSRLLLFSSLHHLPRPVRRWLFPDPTQVCAVGHNEVSGFDRIDMTMELTNSHNPSNEVISVTKLPEQFDGFVDTEILADINKYLSQSENSDDIALATWVKQNYLYEPVIEAGRQIRDSEGFSNLDKAYRRAFSLKSSLSVRRFQASGSAL